MATDFWASSHYQRWIVDRATLRQARTEDLLYVDNPEYLEFLNIYFANVISKLGKKLQLRQRVIATATVFFRRFYLKSSYCETDPFLVISACCYVAAKAEESPVHIKNVVSESRTLFNHQYGIKTFPSDNTKLAEMEFYLVDDLDCDLVVFHPYRTLLALCRKESGDSSHETEAGELGVGISGDEGPRYWGSDGDKLELSEPAFQTAWFIINDTYRSELCLIYPPHLIAIAAIYLTFVLHQPTQAAIAHLLPSMSGTKSSPTPPTTEEPSGPRRSSRQHTVEPKKQQDPIAFLAGLNVSMQHVATIAQEIISLYCLWDRYKEDSSPDAGSSASKQRVRGSGGSRAPSEDGSVSSGTSGETETVATQAFLTKLLLRMREQRIADMSHPPNGKPVAVNKMLERTQAAG
ncbi:RNA polymerase II holoenzyme cyclin-like subunit [Paramarasmius palmivorus]|uniref:RNA polymerase II holoenzyme cyclin-like subunit n=1 Tax=Paramarasmius palmivorus TaxID=297713 RepID=A0AAW0C0I4_9AGAR